MGQSDCELGLVDPYFQKKKIIIYKNKSMATFLEIMNKIN